MLRQALIPGQPRAGNLPRSSLTFLLLLIGSCAHPQLQGPQTVFAGFDGAGQAWVRDVDGRTSNTHGEDGGFDPGRPPVVSPTTFGPRRAVWHLDEGVSLVAFSPLGLGTRPELEVRLTRDNTEVVVASRPLSGSLVLQGLYLSPLGDRGVLVFTQAGHEDHLVLELRQKRAQLANLLGVHALRSGQGLEAEAAFIEAYELDPSSGDAPYNLACSYALSHRFEEAGDWLELALSINRAHYARWADTDPDLQSLRVHPRGRELFGKR